MFFLKHFFFICSLTVIFWCDVCDFMKCYVKLHIEMSFLVFMNVKEK